MSTCNRCQKREMAQWEAPLDVAWEDEGWLPMWCAPRNATNVRARVSDGAIHELVHFAQDLSGEEQPPFSGWFERRGSSCAEVSDVKAWMPIAATPSA